jgi:hypothetical protein
MVVKEERVFLDALSAKGHDLTQDVARSFG